MSCFDKIFYYSFVTAPFGKKENAHDWTGPSHSPTQFGGRYHAPGPASRAAKKLSKILQFIIDAICKSVD